MTTAEREEGVRLLRRLANHIEARPEQRATVTVEISRDITVRSHGRLPRMETATTKVSVYLDAENESDQP